MSYNYVDDLMPIYYLTYLFFDTTIIRSGELY